MVKQLIKKLTQKGSAIRFQMDRGMSNSVFQMGGEREGEGFPRGGGGPPLSRGRNENHKIK